MHRQICLFAIAVTIAFFTTNNSHAQDASALLRMKVSLVQCGQTRADLPRACKEDQRCCVFLDGQQDMVIATAEPNWREALSSSNTNNRYYQPISE